MANHKDNKRTQWLDQLQEQSWNLELIITGFVLFGLFQLRTFLKLKAIQYSANEVNGFGLIFTETINWYLFFNYFCGVFILSLLTLIFVRGLWIGAIGLRYVSGDIDFDRFRYDEKFKQYLRQKIGSFDRYIDTLENLSSSILAFAYLLFFASISLSLYIFEIDLITDLLRQLGVKKGSTLAEILGHLLYLPGYVVAFDFLTLGWLKTIKLPIFRKIFFVLYRLVGAMTLSFLWRPILLNFLDQKYAKWLILMIPIVIFSLDKLDAPTDYDYKFFPRQDLSYSGEVMRTSFHPRYYDNLRQLEKEAGNYMKIWDLSLPNHVIASPIMKVFVKYNKSLDYFIERVDSSMIVINNMESNNRRAYSLFSDRPAVEYAEYYKERATAIQQRLDLMEADVQRDSTAINFNKKEKLAYQDYLTQLKSIIKQYYSFEINQQMIPDSLIRLAFYVHPNLGEKGLICTFPLENVHLGINELTLKRKYYVDSFSDYRESDFTIPFIYEGAVSND